MKQIDTCPYVTLAGLQEFMAARGMIVSRDTVWTFPGGSGLSFQKTLVANEPKRSDIKRRCERW